MTGFFQRLRRELSQVRAAHATVEFSTLHEPGERVHVQALDGKYYPATVVKRTGNTHHIKWDEGGPAERVNEHYIRPHPQARPKPPPAPKPVTPQRAPAKQAPAPAPQNDAGVYAKHPSGEYRPATIKHFDGSKRRVAFSDGKQALLHRFQVHAVEKNRSHVFKQHQAALFEHNKKMHSLSRKLDTEPHHPDTGRRQRQYLKMRQRSAELQNHLDSLR